MKPYPNSKSLSAMRAEWCVFQPDGTLVEDGVLLSTTKARRALWRLIAHLWKQYPHASRIEAHFPSLDIYCGEDREEAA